MSDLLKTVILSVLLVDAQALVSIILALVVSYFVEKK